MASTSANSSSSTNDMEHATPSFDHAARFHRTAPPNPSWKPGQGLTTVAPEGADAEVYDLFARSRTAEGQEALFKRVDPASTPPGDLYKLMIGGIAPRPIGFCSTLDENGTPNLAPFSYFQAAGHQPPIIFLSFTVTGRKDSCNNIKATKEFTVNIISEPFIEAANYTSIDAPPGLSEWEMSGLTQIPSQTVKPPRVAESAFSMECQLEHFYDIKSPTDPDKVTGVVILGRVKLFHVRKDTITERGSIDPARLLPVSRLGGISYGRTTQAYDMPRPKYEEEVASGALDSLKQQPGAKLS